ncbi:MAG TPA: galactosyltransferase-related protein [Casimicrobiaceae bacterium]|nr:galactosyltransferase-related protein [Casimicrobiaceae bacterium]
MEDTAYILIYRENGDGERRDNLLAVLRWLERRPRLEVIVLEQDGVPRFDPTPTSVNRRMLFAYNPGLFNKSWGFNVAARQTARPILVFADADVVVDSSLDQAIDLCRDGVDAAKPYRRIVDLTADESRRVRAGDWGFVPQRPADAPPNREATQEFVVFAGGLFVIGREPYLRLGGFDERFRGWGGEDDAMTIKLQRSGMRLAECGKRPALHLWHPRKPEDTHKQPHYAANRQLLADYAAYRDDELARLCEVQRQVIGNPHKYSPAR